MRYLSVCSGIEAATVAWHSLGWTPAAFSEIEAFPRAVLAHHYPSVPLHGDFTTIEGNEYGPVDLLVGGTPCQDFSVAGLRAGIAGDRGNLTLEFLRLAARTKPRWIVWENVPGVLSSDGGRALGAFLGGLAELGYGFAYRVLDAQYFGLAQRRARVFVVGYLGDWRRAAAVLFERESLLGHPAPRREAGKGVAPTISARPTGGGGLGTDFDCDGGLIANWPADVAPTLNAHFGDKQGLEDQHALNGAGLFVAHALRAEGFDASEDGTGRGTPLVPVPFDTTQITSKANYSSPKPGDPCHPLAAGAHAPAIAFSAKDHGGDAGDISPTLRGGGHHKSHANGGVMPAVAFDLRGREGGAQFEGPHDTANMRAASGGSSRSYVAHTAVRRLTPRECERLQGFPDDYTLVPYRGKPAADGPRYKALGNSMAVPVMAWIGQRIAMVERMSAPSSTLSEYQQEAMQ
jgi:DNA (cytosine-5)-methyltransferase 1